MVINMNETQLCTIEQIRQFLSASAPIEFSAAGEDGGRYAHISRVLKRFDYPRCSRADRGLLRGYLQHTSGYSRAQIARLIAHWQGNRLAVVPLVKRYRAPRTRFARRYTAEDVRLLVEMDKAHEDLCGPAIVHLLRRAWREYGDARYERLAGLSASHLYNLRGLSGTAHPVHADPFGEERHRRAQGAGAAGAGRLCAHRHRPSRRRGWHQGGVSHHLRRRGDAVAGRGLCAGHQRGLSVAGAGTGSGAVPVRGAGLSFDNGSEYINHQVAKLLEKLRIEQTKSRSRHSNDNALAESKNASVVRKHMGYAHIPQEYANAVNAFYRETFNPWLNLHRPCLFATDLVSPKGKVVKRYRPKDVKTPLEALALLEMQGLAMLRTGVTLNALHAQARSQADLTATQAMQQAKSALFASFEKPRRRAQ